MDDHEIYERLATLEERADQGGRDRAEMKESMDGLHSEFGAFQETLNGMKEQLAKYHGFWGGALLIISAIWAFIELAGDWLLAKIRGEA